MDQIESIQERQDNEFQVIKAIYFDDLCDLREKAAWNIWRPIDITLTLRPQRGSSGPHEMNAQVNLHVICGPQYPNLPPEIKLENNKGISSQNLLKLQNDLNDTAAKLKGKEMILDLAQQTQAFLHQNYTKTYKSFYEEMISTKEQQVKDTQHRQKIQEEKERMLFKDEIERRQAALIEEDRLRRCQRFSQTENDPNNQSNEQSPSITRSRSSSYIRQQSYRRRRVQSTSESSEGSFCEPDHRRTVELKFNSRGERQVTRGKCLGHSSLRGSIVYAGIDNTTGELMAICEWNIKLHANMDNKYNEQEEPSEIVNIMKQVSSIEQELNFLHKLFHPNLVRLINMKFCHEDDNLAQIYILQEFVIGSSISIYMDGLSADTDLIRHLTSGILEALVFLHKNNVVHKDLRATSIFLDRTGNVKLSDYSIDKRLADLHQTTFQDHIEGLISPPHGKACKKSDIFRLGQVTLSLATSTNVTSLEPKIPANLSSDLRDFITKCIIKDERQRWSADQLINHPFVKPPIERRLTPQQTCDDDSNENKDENDEDETPDIDIPMTLPFNSKVQSRIGNDFEVLQWLGKGGFGDVLKVRNKLDGRVYAIKRIALNPRNKLNKKKITREVKLLSRLNHENVVRYFNSWIEFAILQSPTSNGSLEGGSGDYESSTYPETSQDLAEHSLEKEIFSGLNIPGSEHNSQIEWNVSYVPKENASSEEESSDDEDWFPFGSTRSESSDGIVFENADGTSQVDSISIKDESQSDTNLENKSDNQGPREIQFMYIQMEFCEKSTLRTAIDTNLFEDQERLWRLFTEVVEGLAHIHQQGMIHRDLKPVNIFLDNNDQVKIGDFGLATTNILPRPNTANGIRLETPEMNNADSSSFASTQGDALTGQVGTTLYVAPEVLTSEPNAYYNQKVDIFSLGIILFEMSYHRLTTNMERYTILQNIRKKPIIFPDDFNNKLNAQNVQLISWLLNHDPSQRPSAQEILTSTLLPAPQLEENGFQELVQNTLAKPQTKAYTLLVKSCFDQEVNPAEDVTFDMLVRSGLGQTSELKKPLSLARNLELSKDKVRRIFEKHGAIGLTTSLLIPQTRLYENPSVGLMTRTGGLVSLPYDLRVPFARYIALNGINKMKRYAIDRVYREKKASGFHPRELVECAFDIVTPTTNTLMAEAEILAVAWEAVSEFPDLSDKNCSFRLNHTSLLKAILLFCNIESEKHNDIYTILAEEKNEGQSRFQIQTRLISMCLTDHAMRTLFTLIDKDCSIDELSIMFQRITKRKEECATLAKKAIEDLQIITKQSALLGVSCPIMIAPGLVYNVHQYSGMICQLACELKKKRGKRCCFDLIAAGGRYDNMLSKFRNRLERTGMSVIEPNQSAVGISISLDKLASSSTPPAAFDVALASIGQLQTQCETKLKILKDLWDSNLKTHVIENIHTLEEIQNECKELNISHIILLKESEPGFVRLRSGEKDSHMNDRFQEKRLSFNELIDTLQRVLRVSTTENCEQSPSIAPSKVEPHKPQALIHFFTDDKLTNNTRRRSEYQIQLQIQDTLQRLSGRLLVMVFVLSVDEPVIKTMASQLKPDLSNLNSTLQICFERHPRYKRYLKEISDDILKVCTGKSNSLIILYSLSDQFYKVIL